MRGSVIKRTRKDGSDVWCIKYTDQFGKQRWETIGPRKREAERALASRIAAVEAGALPQPSRKTFSEFLPEWEAAKTKSVRPGTMVGMQGHVRNHLEPYFGERQLRTITLGDIQRFVNQWTGGANTLRKVLATLSGILRAAAVDGQMLALDFRALTLPTVRQAMDIDADEDVQVLTLPEVYHLMDSIDERYAPDILFLAMTGLRRGEWIALQDRHIDLEQNTALVRQTLDATGGFGPPKGGQARRVLLFDKARDAVIAKRQIKKELGLENNPFAFPTPTGGVIQPSNWFNRVWTPAITRAGFPDLRLHDLRHTAASLMIRAGAPAHFVANQLGHTDPAFTMRTYAHWFEDQNVAAMKSLNEKFSSMSVASGREVAEAEPA